MSQGVAMKSSQKMMIAFLLNLSFAIIEVIFGLAFNSSAVLADAVHDTGDALAIGLSTLLEKISNKKEDSRYTLGYKRYSLLGAILTSIILITGSLLVLWENVPKVFAPEPVDYNGMLVLGIVAILVNLAASKVVSHGHSHNESILSLHFLEDILGWLAVLFRVEGGQNTFGAVRISPRLHAIHRHAWRIFPSRKVRDSSSDNRR